MKILRMSKIKLKLILDKEKESMKHNEDQSSIKENIDKRAEGDTMGVDAQDCNDKTNKILLGVTLLKHLKKVNVKGDKE